MREAEAKRSSQETTPISYVVGACLYMLAGAVNTLVRKVSSAFGDTTDTTRVEKSSGLTNTEKEKEREMGKSIALAKRMPSLYSGNGKYCKAKKSEPTRRISWYLDVRLWFPVFAILVAAVIVFYQGKIEKLTKETELYFVEKAAEEAVVETIAETEPPTEAQQDSEAVALARLADSVARGRSDEVKRIVMWVAINRSEDRSHGYGLSLLEEIARPKQWQEYSPDANYLESTLRLAEEVLEVRDSGGARPIYGDMLWFVLNNDGSITVRNQFQVSKNRSEATFGQ